ncbi:hypothetical protein HPB49_004293 [Dermacentor silvarum]|uniref:Uncharacterized protein n=1 Tax=Dermacentor silvarum TaxID=543639 RepID=A0ACB8D2I8_DERSI|nr:hypothetical protein HPB49_004293 [Dermacentor silvarum]
MSTIEACVGVSLQCASAVAAATDISQDDAIDAVDMTPEEILDWREKFVYSDTKRPSPTSPSTLKTRPPLIATYDRHPHHHGKSYEVSTHVADPENSCRGVIKLPASLVEGNVLVKLRDSNPTMKILAARRIGSTDSILVTFEGSKVPFYIDYLRTDLRCRPYRQKVEACAKCRQFGHCQGVCPNVTIRLCPKCGRPDPPEDHSCTPICIIWNGTHETGSSECRHRYKPRTPPPAPPDTKLTLLARNNIQASNQHPGQEKLQSSSGRKNSATAPLVLSSKQPWPPLTPCNEERPPINHTKCGQHGMGWLINSEPVYWTTAKVIAPPWLLCDTAAITATVMRSL